VEARVPEGVPLITQVVVFILKPVASAGEMIQLEIAELLLLRVVGVTVIGTLTEPVVPDAPI
jgi:hypothetical protein